MTLARHVYVNEHHMSLCWQQSVLGTVHGPHCCHAPDSSSHVYHVCHKEQFNAPVLHQDGSTLHLATLALHSPAKSLAAVTCLSLHLHSLPLILHSLSPLFDIEVCSNKCITAIHFSPTTCIAVAQLVSDMAVSQMKACSYLSMHIPPRTLYQGPLLFKARPVQ